MDSGLDGDLTLISARIGERIRARREQMHISQEDLAGVIDLDAQDIEQVENGARELPDAELGAIATYLCASDAYLAGDQDLNDLVESDQAETDQMISWIATAFRGLPNQMERHAAYTEIKDLLE